MIDKFNDISFNDKMLRTLSSEQKHRLVKSDSRASLYQLPLYSEYPRALYSMYPRALYSMYPRALYSMYPRALYVLQFPKPRAAFSKIASVSNFTPKR